MTRSLIATAGLLLGFLAVISCAGRQEASKKDILDICGSCHGSTGVTYTFYIPNLAGQNYEYLVNQLRHFRGIDGKGDTRANATMDWHALHNDEKDIDRLARYYAEQACAKGIYTWGGGDLENACTSCHGSHGHSSDPNIPNLAGQKVPYMRKQMAIFQNSAKGSPNENPHIYRTSEAMGQIAGSMQVDEAMSALYFFNAQGCR